MKTKKKDFSPEIVHLDAEVGADGVSLMGARESYDFRNNTRSFRDETGRLVTMDLGVQDVHVDTMAANVLVDYKNGEYIADKVCQVILRDKPSGKFFIMDPDDTYQSAQGQNSIAPGANAREISPRLSKTSYAVKQYAFGAFLPTEIEKAADIPLRPQLMYAKRCMNALLLQREIRVAKKLTTSGNWAPSNVLALGTGQNWNGGTSSDPVNNLLAASVMSLKQITAWVMSRPVFNAFFQNPAVRAYTQYKSNEPVMPGYSVNQYTFPGLPPILISDAKYRTAAGTYAYIWGNSPVGIVNPATPMTMDGEDVASALTFRWQAPGDDAVVQDGVTVRSFFLQDRGTQGGRKFVVGINDAEKILDNTVGAIITGVIV